MGSIKIQVFLVWKSGSKVLHDTQLSECVRSVHVAVLSLVTVLSALELRFSTAAVRGLGAQTC